MNFRNIENNIHPAKMTGNKGQRKTEEKQIFVNCKSKANKKRLVDRLGGWF